MAVTPLDHAVLTPYNLYVGSKLWPVRKVQVFLRDDQKAALKRVAARTGRKQSDLIRAGVDLVLESDRLESAGWREATRAAAGIWRDRTDLDEASRAMREAAKKRFKSVYGAA